MRKTRNQFQMPIKPEIADLESLVEPFYVKALVMSNEKAAATLFVTPGFAFRQKEAAE